MKSSRKFFFIQSVISVVLGIFIIISAQTTILGAVIGTGKIENSLSIAFGLFFIIAGIALYVVNKTQK